MANCKTKGCNTVDILKLIMAIFIVGIHSNLLNLETYREWMISSVLFRLGVPFFFAVSGYFLASKVFKNGPTDTKEGRLVIRSYVRNLLIPLILWGGVGLLIQTVDLLCKNTDLFHLAYYTYRAFMYPLNAMWYVLASMIGAVILYYIYTHFKRWKFSLIVYSAIAYSVLLVCNNYYFLTKGTFLHDAIHWFLMLIGSARNGVFCAPVFMGMGFLLRDNSIYEWISKRKWLLILSLVIGFGLLYFEATQLFGVYSTDDKGYFLSQLIVIPAIVNITLSYNIDFNLPYQLFRRMSRVIFYTHCTIIRLFEHIHYFDNHKTVLFLLTLGFCLSLSFWSYFSKNKKVQLVLG